MTSKSDRPAEPSAGDAAPKKAKIVLPKLPPRGEKLGQPAGGKGTFQRDDHHHSQTARAKPMRLPGRNG